jgi:two-component system cell cycle sensor histidine kinase/response regulator CckA
MTDAVMKAAGGDYSIRLDTSNGHDEINALADAINRMLDTVREQIAAYKQTEGGFRESEERLRQAVRVSHIGIFDHNHLTDTIYWSLRQREIHGWGSDDPVSLPAFFDLVHPEDRERIAAAVGRAHDPAGDGLFDVDHRIILRDGTVRWTTTRSQTFFAGEGGARRPVRTVGAVRDITEHKQAIEALEESEKRYRTLFDTMAQGVVYQAADGSIVAANAAAQQILGLSLDQMKERSSLDPRWRSVHEDGSDFPGDRHPAMLALRTGKPVNGVLMGVFHPGVNERRWILVDAIPEFRPGETRPYRVFATFTDITERKRVEAERTQLLNVLETSQNEIYIFDSESLLFQYVNRGALRNLGYASDRVISMTPVDLKPEFDETSFRNFIAPLLRREQEKLTFETVHRRADGSDYPVEVHLYPAEYRGRRAFLAIILDISERKKAEEEKAKLESQLIQAQKMESIGRLAGGVAHDFNNMLSVILGYAELLKARLPAGDPLVKDVLEIEKAGIHSRDITRQLLAFSRKQIIEPRSVNLNDLIESAQNTLARLIGEDIDQRFHPGKDLWKIKIDPSQVDQILMNLAINARDAMPRGGKLMIETKNIHLDEAYCRTNAECLPGHYVLLEVSDDGAGMDKEILSHIFEPFFTTKEVGKGTGLGLATVYGIVKQNNGFINVYSEPGRGTTFKIYIPRIRGEEITEKNEETIVAKGTGTVLLVEDNVMVRGMTTAVLKELGYTVLVAETPQNALSLCESKDTTIDLLMTDVVMPEMNGTELRDKIRAIRPEIKVLFMSGYTSNVIVHRGVLGEGVQFVQKPFSMHDLARKVREAIGGR